MFLYYTLFFYKQHFFSTKSQCSLTFSWIELQMLLRCCLKDTSIIILRLFIFTIFVPVSRPRYIYSISMSSVSFSSSFSLWLWLYEYRHICFFAYFLEYVPLFLENNMDKDCEKFSNSKSSGSGCCWAFAWIFAKFRLAFIIKPLLIKIKACNLVIFTSKNTRSEVSYTHYLKVCFFLLTIALHY